MNEFARRCELKMKRLLAAALACMLTLGALVCACAEDTEEEWYTLEEGNTVLTVRLSGSSKTGLDWESEISAPEVMEQTSDERIVGRSEGMAGTPFTRVLRFAAKSGESGAVSLIFRYVYEDGIEIARTLVLEMLVDENGVLTLKSIYDQQPYDSWCETVGNTLTIYLPAGCEWSYELLDPQALTPAKERMEEDGSLAISFQRAEAAPENIELVVSFAESESRALHMRTITLQTEGDDLILVERVSELTTFE